MVRACSREEENVTALDLLDHGYIKLVDYMGGDEKVVASARVSYAKDTAAGAPSGDERLIRYLWKNRHTSPFEHVVFSFEVQAPIFVMRQWHRHRTQSYNEVSARYTEIEGLFFVPDPATIGVQSKSSKQARETSEPHPYAQSLSETIDATNRSAYRIYKMLLDHQVPRELARVVLPQSMYTRMFATVNLWNLFHFIELRDHAHAQHEIRAYAKAALDLIRPVVPVCVQVFEEMRQAA